MLTPIDWAHTIVDPAGVVPTTTGFLNEVSGLLLTIPVADLERARAFRDWIQAVILPPLVTGSPEILHASLVLWIRISGDWPMSGPPKISPTDVARYFALVQPPLIANRLFEDTSFRTEFGLDSREAISFDGGPAILKATFYDGVRKMFAEQRPQFLAALTGDAITVTVIGDDIALSFQAEGGVTTTVHSLNPMFLSPCADVRQAALQRMINELGPTGPDPSYWQKELQQGALDDGRTDHLSREIDAAVVPHMARVARDIMAGVLDKHNLVQRSLTYWRLSAGRCRLGWDKRRG